MGVKQLWNILEPVKEKQTLSDLTNKTLCVDLSFWICEALQAKHLCQHVNKPHLRNLLLRLLKFTEFRVKLVFVMDGRPPELKLEAIRKRNEIQTGGGKIFGSGSASARRIEGSEFSKCVNEVSVAHLVFMPRSLEIVLDFCNHDCPFISLCCFDMISAITQHICMNDRRALFRVSKLIEEHS